MAELATLARPYAEALFKAVSVSEAQSAATQLSELAQVASDEQLKAFADNPRTTVNQVFEVVTSATKTVIGARVKNLLRVVIENGRTAALPEIAAQFKALVNAQSGSSDAIVNSAFPIDDGELAAVVASLERRFGRKLKARVVIDPELIGGIRVVVGDEVLDTSVKARLEQMKVALTA
jgi:F-type H+-transporting ATPase subunit delta